MVAEGPIRVSRGLPVPGTHEGDRGTEDTMSLMQRITAFLRSPRGQQLVDRGRREMSKPENQARLRQIATRLQSRRR
ncbi:hypothetical protein MCBG_01729 [Micromonospora sp. M42]|nr:hypothetical protein MCBG_01729 [Micromonospora sp. M42]